MWRVFTYYGEGFWHSSDEFDRKKDAEEYMKVLKVDLPEHKHVVVDEKELPKGLGFKDPMS